MSQIQFNNAKVVPDSHALVANMFSLFTKESCEKKTYKALARRVLAGIFDIIRRNDLIERFTIVPLNKDRALVWNNPHLIVAKKEIDLSQTDWNKTVMAMPQYSELDVDARKSLIDDIQAIIDYAQSYFPHYLPKNAKSEVFILDNRFVFKIDFTGNEAQDVIAGGAW